MSEMGCEHFEDYKKRQKNLDTLKWTHMVFVVGNSCEAKVVKLRNVYCRTCKKRGPFMHVCLDCYYFGCHKHIREHTASEDHPYAMDLLYGQLHCTACGDYIYDAAFDAITRNNKMRAGTFKRRLFECTSWNPTAEERQLLEQRTERICITPDSMIGLRGLVNLGSTCFMNCIVQALIHTPPLRDYFLTQCYNCTLSHSEGDDLFCVSRLFQEFYKGVTVPLALPELLLLVWTHAPHLAGNKQHDAHEFFIETLNVWHRQLTKTVAKPEPMSTCPCIIHQIFTGRLQSDVVCQNCNGVSTTTDPIWDFSLDLGPVMLDGRPPRSLIDCLERFTRAEHLGELEQIMCENCGSKQESTKQLTMKTLPVVVSFHLKRFEHLREEEGRKISTSISFPEMLNLTPFMSRKRERSAFPSDNRYSLFAVIVHSGHNFGGGHYTAFVRQQQDHWYKCNDTIVTRATLKEVLDSEGYILFYHKHVLEYE